MSAQDQENPDPWPRVGMGLIVLGTIVAGLYWLTSSGFCLYCLTPRG